MSHVVVIDTEIRDPVALGLACQRINVPAPQWRTASLFSNQATGYCVELPEWKYPVVCNTDTGHLSLDNFGGRWGEQRELDRLMQAYACEKAKLEARRNGHTVTEQTLADGSIKLTVHVGDSA